MDSEFWISSWFEHRPQIFFSSSNIFLRATYLQGRERKLQQQEARRHLTFLLRQWIYSLTVGEIIQLQVFHGVYQHHLVHLFQHVLLIEDPLSGSLPPDVML